MPVEPRIGWPRRSGPLSAAVSNGKIFPLEVPMAKRSADVSDSDRIEGFAHPRETHALLGQDAALGRAARAIRAGRTPSAWLITGAPGIGKATLAYRIARYLLAYGATDAGPEDLSLPEDHKVARQVAAGAHPGLLVLKRALNPKTGKLMT